MHAKNLNFTFSISFCFDTTRNIKRNIKIPNETSPSFGLQSWINSFFEITFTYVKMLRCFCYMKRKMRIFVSMYFAYGARWNLGILFCFEVCSIVCVPVFVGWKGNSWSETHVHDSYNTIIKLSSYSSVVKSLAQRSSCIREFA